MVLYQEQLWHLVELWKEPKTALTLDVIMNSLVQHGTQANVAAQMVVDGLNEGYLYVDRIQPVPFGYLVWIGLTDSGESTRRMRTQQLGQPGW
jgi:branched-subunit amino acid permease